MCRMIGFVSSDQISVLPYFNALINQAQYGKNAPHKDGWGFSTYAEGEFDFKKSLKPVFEDKYMGPSRAFAAVFHARQASPSTKIVYQNAHPFIFQRDQKIWSFAHNGTINNLPESLGNELDSKIYVNLIEDGMKRFEPSKAYKMAVEIIKKDCKFSSINSFLASDDEFMAVRVSDDGHKLFYRISPTLFEISTEPLDESWAEMNNDAMIIAKKVGRRIDVAKITL